MWKIVFTLLMLSLSLAARAETDANATEPSATRGVTRFVSDELTIMLRTGPSNKHKIVKALNSGAQLEAYEIDGEYQRVKVQNGVEGWVLSQHVTDKPIARQQLASTNDKLAQLEAKNKQLQEQLKQLRDNYSKLNEDFRLLDKNKGELEEELVRIRDIAAEPLQLSNEKQQLSQQAQSLENQVGTLRSELDSLRNNTHKQWFLTGAAVVLLGILIGLTIPKLRRHRRSDWSNI